MKTKRIALLSLLLALVLLFAGCDLGGSTVTTSPVTTTAPVTTAPPTDAAVPYEPLTLGDGTVIPAGAQVTVERMEGVKLFVTQKTEVHV